MPWVHERGGQRLLGRRRQRKDDRWPLARWVHDLPIRVFPDDLAISEFQKVTAADLDLLTVLRCAGKRPLRDRVVA